MAAPEPDAGPLEAVLADGTRVHFRQIRPDDKASLQRGVAAMSPESRYRRFFAPVDHLTDAQLAYFTEVDQVDHVAWVAVLADSPDSRVVGVARFVRLTDEPGSAEAAVTVIDEFQGKGLGRALLVVLTREAIRLGIRRFSMVVLGENAAMMSLLHDAGAVSDGISDGVYKLHVALPERIEDLDESAAPAVLKVAAQGRIQSEIPAGEFWTRFLVGKR